MSVLVKLSTTLRDHVPGYTPDPGMSVDISEYGEPSEGCYTYNTRSSMVSLPKGKVAVINGLRDYIVVDTEDVLLICPRAEEQNIKKYIDEVKYNTGDKHI